jgi:hypothetical protein
VELVVGHACCDFSSCGCRASLLCLGCGDLELIRVLLCDMDVLINLLLTVLTDQDGDVAGGFGVLVCSQS